MLNLDNSEIRTHPCPTCYLCEATGNVLYQKLHDRLFGAPGEWDLKKCSNPKCGLVWLDPMPIEEDIHKAYKTYYTHETDYVNENILRRFVKAVYLPIKATSAYLLGLKSEEVQLENMYLNKVNPGNLLDIGCGSGKFLNQMRLAGWEVQGIELDSKSAEIASEKYGIKIKICSLEDAKYPDKFFDAITMSHVIEHVSNPVLLLQESYRILKPGGYLVVTTPNIDSYGHKKFADNWRGLEPPRHLHLFSPVTLKKCAKKTNFEKIDTWTTAAHSKGIFIENINLQGDQNPRKINVSTSLKSLFFESYEFLLAKKYPDICELVILICRKL